MPESRYYVELRERYLRQAKCAVIDVINSRQHVDYDHLWASALRYPMVWEHDLRLWLRQWRDAGTLKWLGLAPRGRELIRGKHHSVALVGSHLAKS